MKFGIFYEHQIGRPWEDDTDVRLIHDALEQIELADRLGIQYAWEVEHHFLEEYSHSSAPEVFLAAASQRTQRIRLGHGIVLTAPQFNHPARVAERIAMLDLVSNGRVEFGSGESGSEAELGGFGVPTLRKRDAWLEGSRDRHSLHGRDPVHRRRRRVRLDAAPQRRPQAGAEAASAAVGRVQPPRHDPAGGAQGHRRADVRLHRPRRGAALGDRLRAHADRGVRAGRLRRQPAGGVRDTDDAAPRRRRGDPARRRGRQLLRLQPRPLLRVRHAPAGRHQRVAGVPGAARRAGLRPRGGRASDRGGAARRQGGGRRHDRAAGLHRHAAAGARVPAPLRGGRRRPGDLRAPGRPHPARAHHGVDRAVRPRGAARVRRARRGAVEAQAATARAAHRGGARPQADRPRSTSATTRSTRCPSSGPTPPTTTTSTASSRKFADDRAAGRRDPALGILG